MNIPAFCFLASGKFDALTMIIAEISIFLYMFFGGSEYFVIDRHSKAGKLGKLIKILFDYRKNKMYEKNIKSSNNFLNILHIFDKNSSNNYPNNKIKSESKNNYLSKPTEYIEKLPTYEKIRIMQILLKEIILIKERFEKNKIIMLERIEKNCKEYYNNQIGMKAIYDYCRSNNPEKYYNYVLVQNNEDKFGKKNYEIIHKIIFLIRNNNDILLNLISNCPKNSFDQFADFLVKFLFK